MMAYFALPSRREGLRRCRSATQGSISILSKFYITGTLVATAKLVISVTSIMLIGNAGGVLVFLEELSVSISTLHIQYVT